MKKRNIKDLGKDLAAKKKGTSKLFSKRFPKIGS